MPNLTYKKQFLLLIIWVPIVILIFRFVNNRALASLIASVGFILMPGVFFVREWRVKKHKLHIGALALFLFGAAFPIFLLRVFYWGKEFSSIYFMGLSAAVMHRASSVLYFIMLASTLYHWKSEK